MAFQTRNSSRTSTSSSGGGKWGLMLFSLPFAGIGLFMGGVVLWTLAEWGMMQSWEPAPCTILRAHTETHRGDDSDTYEAVAEYSYQWEGRQYSGSRVGLHTSSDNLGSWHEDIVNDLNQAKRRGQPWTGYVNPSDPQQAVLDRSLRYGKLAFMGLFGVIFGGVGFGILIGSRWAEKKRQKKLAADDEHPGEPWLAREDWAAGRVRPSGWLGIAVLGGMGLFCILLSSPAVVAIPSELEDGNRAILVALLFPLAGLVLLGTAGRMLLQRRKGGNPEFIMASVPGVIGGPLAGVIRFDRTIDARNGWELSLTCIRRTSSGKNNHETAIWQEQKILTRTLDGQQFSGTAVPVYFAIPFDAEPSDDEGPRTIEWRLELKADVPGIDIATQFEVPVFRTPASSEDFEPLDALAEYEHQLSDEDLVRAAGLRVETTGDTVRIRQPMASQPGLACSLTVFLVIWLGATWFAWNMGAPLLFPIVFGMFGIGMTIFTIDLWLWSSTLEAEDGRLTIHTGMPLLARTVRYAPEDIKSLRASSSMQSGTKMYYSLKLHTTSGKRITLLRHLQGKIEAERISRLLERTVGLNGEQPRRQAVAAHTPV
ncbi:MAG: DUF3592 domain-containing protein [Planctomycetaceae bacterium]|nr:DUF3592 domain-containing protein [Planctomycetaceae bacterium]